MSLFGSLEGSGVFQNYKIGKHLGSGFSGSVYTAKQTLPSDSLEKNQQRLVVKIVSTNDENFLEMARNEKEVLD